MNGSMSMQVVSISFNDNDFISLLDEVFLYPIVIYILYSFWMLPNPISHLFPLRLFFLHEGLSAANKPPKTTVAFSEPQTICVCSFFTRLFIFILVSPINSTVKRSPSFSQRRWQPSTASKVSDETCKTSFRIR